MANVTQTGGSSNSNWGWWVLGAVVIIAIFAWIAWGNGNYGYRTNATVPATTGNPAATAPANNAPANNNTR